MTDERHPSGTPEDFEDQIRIEVDEIVEDARSGRDPLSLGELADSLERQIGPDRIRVLDPPDEVFWRAVVTELRRRAAPHK